jgi:hypothetical protein
VNSFRSYLFSAWPPNSLRIADKSLYRGGGDAVGEAGGQCGPSGNVAHSFVGYVDAAGDDVFDLLEGYPDVLTGTAHRHPQQIIKPQMRQRSP